MEQIIFLQKKICIKKILLFAFIILLSCNFNSFPTYASSLMGIEGQFDGLSGDAKYAGKEYRDNYQLDVEHLGLTEAGTKMMADFSNGIWMVIYYFAFLAIAVFYHAMSLDFAKILGDQIQTIQAALHDSVFQPLLMIAIIGTFSIIVLKYARRDFTGLIEEFGKIFFIMILSVWLVKDSAGLLSGATNITKGLSTSVLSELANVDVGGDVGGIKLGDGTELYAQQASGVLWVSLIHQSWLSLEFGNYKPSEEEIEQFLTADTSEKREELVKKVMEDNPKVFSKDRVAGRIAQAIIMLILIAVKSVIYGALAVLQIILQIFAIACVLLAAFILFLALIPSYGFDILGIWVKKIFETQLAVLLLTFLMGFMILISNIISSISGSLGWMVGLVLEVAIGVGLFKFRSQIFSMFTSVGKTGKLVLHPSALKHALEYGMSPSDFYPGFGGDGPLRRRNKRSSRYQNEYDDGEYYDDDLDDTDDSSNTAPVSNQTSSKLALSKPVTYNQEAPAIQPQDESGSYYATYEESSNWRDQWYTAQRPTTQIEKTMKRAPLNADSSPDLNISESNSDRAEDIQHVKQPLSVQGLQEVDSAEDEQQVLGTESSMKIVRPVIGQGLQERERTDQRLQNHLDVDTGSLESYPKEYIRERPRIEEAQIYEEARSGESYDSGLVREYESQNYSPEEYTVERPKIEAPQVYEEERSGERYESGFEHESELQDSSTEDYKRQRPRIEETQIYEDESTSERYDDHFVSDEGSQNHIPEEYERERPMIDGEQTKEGGSSDPSFENEMEADSKSAYPSYGNPEAYIGEDTTNLPETVGEWNQERPSIEGSFDEMEKRSSQEPTMRPQSTEDGVDDEKYLRNEDRLETQDMASASYYSGELETSRAAEESDGYKSDVERPNINTELASKRTELPQESIPETPAREIPSKKETSHLKPKTNGKMDKIEPKEIQSKRRLYSKKQVDEVNDKEGEA